MKRLWYKVPANFFEEALPIGNGRLGGMHYAGAFEDIISLNEDTLWSGFPHDKSAENPYDGIRKAGELMSEGKIAEAEKVIRETSLGKWTEAYQPAGKLILSMIARAGKIDDYYRELDLKNAIARSEFSAEGIGYSREAFCSAADDVMVYSFKSDKVSKLELTVESPHPYRASFENGVYIVKSIAPIYAAPVYYECEEPIKYDSFENNRALSYCIVVKPILSNGKYEFKNGILSIESEEFYLIIDVATNFSGFDICPADSNVDELSLALERISNAEKQKLADLKKRHRDDYSALFGRMELHIEGENFYDLPTDERIVNYSKNRADNGLAVLLYDYARYLTIACSRENSQASNLQGIWNEKIRAPWSSNYTLNINTEMNYWHVEKSNLSECHLPLIKFVSELAVNGRKTAEKYYGSKGWCSHHNTDIWRQTDPVGGESSESPIHYAFWNMSGCWLACHIWQHFEYTGDKAFLSENYDVLKGAAEFLLGWLTEDTEGYLVAPLSTSPENKYLTEDGEYALCKGCAMDSGIAAELLNSVSKAARVLKKDEAFARSADQARNRLKPYSIGKDGYILEWNKELTEQDIHHRHISHLFGLYPGNDIAEGTPELRQAAAKVLERRGKEGTGWALGWRMCCESRLRNAEDAKVYLDNMLRLCHTDDTDYTAGGGVYANLFAAHPPFQIDANFAFAAGVNEMLLQVSEKGEEIPLPALPKQWSKGGYVHGIRLTGNREANIEWKNGEVTKFEIRETG